MIVFMVDFPYMAYYIMSIIIIIILFWAKQFYELKFTPSQRHS